MRYVLGVHVGTTRTTAAVCRSGAAHWGQPEVVPLGGGFPWLDSVLHVGPNGDVLTGQDALRRAAAEPDRIARGPLRRTGDAVPLVLADLSYPAETLAAALIGWVVDRVADAEGADPERIVVTHPPGWSGYRRGLLHEALDQAQLPAVLALPSPIAAAESHLARERVEVGQTLAVCRVGGEHVETALLRRGPHGFELLAHADGPEHTAGVYLDDLLVRHLQRELSVDDKDPGAMARLRAACTAAKERLSQASETAVWDDVPVTRAQFEELARPALTAAVGSLERLASTVPSGQLAAAVLVGGTARIPLTKELAEDALSCPVSVDHDPGTALCRGAALAAMPRPEPEPEPTSTSSSLVAASYELPTVYGGDEADDLEPPPERPPVEITPLEPPKRRFTLARKDSSTPDRDEER
ncbi:Hsp70 family protein [Prauserella cavernicola]|uniref:Hsp70 family protein n=1 Tax=Prauserella cavernicola TaxID=2800127 RepID=A0A934QRR4_9PSEU|nr:Hsp70 family protein [Prauserella cavernicola]MBK1784996.1 Hsp70 family protein [Prauserella cavernicola]